jgi:hypothetical protein
MKYQNYFILGGNDGEMVRIKEYLDAFQIPYIQPKMSWGKGNDLTLSDLGAGAMAPATRVIFVECTPPTDFPRVKSHVVVDHHGDNAGLPASLMQVLDLLKIEPTRWDLVIAANDSGWFPGLQALGATPEEMSAVRRADRVAQGITPEHEAEAARALAAPVEMVGDVRIIRMAHSKCAPVGDTLAIEAIANGQPVPQYLVLSGDGEANFSGDGALAQSLFEKYREPNPESAWAGGSGLGKSGGTAYWGGYPDQAELVAFIRDCVEKK